MKLWFRIFVSILVVSLSAILANSIYMINNNHSNNITLEQNRAMNEYDYIRSTISNSMDISSSTKESMKILLDRYGSYYAERGVHLMVYNKEEYLYHEFNDIDMENYEELLLVKADTKMIRILEGKSNPYILVSSLLNKEDGPVLLYARKISEIYSSRSTSIRLTVIFTTGLVLLLSLLSYLFSRGITRPIAKLQQGAIAVSQGDYSIQVPERKDEFRNLAEAFNTMSTAVQERTSELELRAKELQMFIDDLSHEMNTPLTSIQGYAEFIQNAKITEEQRLIASGNIIKQAVRMKDINTKLMALTLTREQKAELDETPIDLLFQNIREAFMPQIMVHKIELEFEQKLTSLRLDRILIEILLGNLIKNSIQAMPEGGRIRIKAYQDHGKPLFEVQDNGIGMPEDKIKDIVKPFYRIDKSRSRKTGGAGLGLSICSNIAKLHQAELIINSQPGIGTTVKVIFDCEYDDLVDRSRTR